MKYGLKEEVIDNLLEVITGNPKIEKVVLYGSRAKNTYRVGSDIDLALYGEDINVIDINLISNKLDDLYLPYHIDLSIYNKIENPEFVEHINRVGITLFSKDDNTVIL
ncbi:hypothetical protein BHU72_04375 [Desulfuribacillus stibiiarsenatis]|uniref:Polymerase beta nucleotidyltransferase domain-containing protein n=1 Tax=Desulfuribacillus stibiiarsenatis TaxID=1390249 RepID=A0A1E5L5F0_9FIRM|nr:nucleotidyltransferase domain-containing protein [Desulfuribacillus stibiiarsenatis]OEH85336.1 hypothetical protein BHU72_04375 [Desulfuribacillus stibiiarsenatis]